MFTCRERERGSYTYNCIERKREKNIYTYLRYVYRHTELLDPYQAISYIYKGLTSRYLATSKISPFSRSGSRGTRAIDARHLQPHPSTSTRALASSCKTPWFKAAPFPLRFEVRFYFKNISKQKMCSFEVWDLTPEISKSRGVEGCLGSVVSYSCPSVHAKHFHLSWCLAVSDNHRILINKAKIGPKISQQLADVLNLWYTKICYLKRFVSKVCCPYFCWIFGPLQLDSATDPVAPFGWTTDVNPRAPAGHTAVFSSNLFGYV